MGDTKGGDTPTTSKKQLQQHLTTSTTSSSPPTHHHQTPPQDSTTDSITTSSFLSPPPPLYTTMSTHVSPTLPSSFDQNQMFDHLAPPPPATTTTTTSRGIHVINTNPKRPRYTSAGQWKLLPSPSPSQKQTLVPYQQQVAAPPVVLSNESTPSPSAPTNLPPSTAAASSSDTAASSPSHPSLSGSAASAGQECTNLSEAGGGDQPPPPPSEQHLQMRKGKVVSPAWKPNEMLWLARAWRIQYEGGGSTSTPTQEGSSSVGRSGTKTRAEKDKQVSDYLKSHGVNRDPKFAGTKWDNMLGDYRKVYRWERCGFRDQTGRSYFRLSHDERRDNDLPANFDQEVYEELCEFMGSRMRTLISTSTRPAGVAFDDSRIIIRSLPPPPIFRNEHEIPLTARAKQLGLTSGGEAFGHGGRGSLLGHDTQHTSSSTDAPLRELERIGKVRMIWEESVNLWAEKGEHHRGRVKLQGLSFLNADELTFLDDSMVACTLETFEEATPLKGFSVDRFVSGQQIKVFGRRKSSSSSAPPPPHHHPASFSGFHDRIQLPYTEPSIRSSSAWEFQDPTDYYLGCLKIPPPTLPSLVELSWHLQEPPPEELRFPLRKDVYKDLPQGKELFFTTSSELLDCRAITYEILSPIIRSNPSLTAATATTRESFIGLWDDCINRLISKFCSLEMVFLRKASTLSADDGIQDQWPNLTAFVRNFCLWRGEETDQVREGHVDPSNSIVEKLSWTYMDLPYILGYYAVGYNVTFCAFSQSQDSNIIRTDLYTLDLSTPSERLKALIPCRRIAGLLPLLAERCLICINKAGNNSPKLLPYSDFERIESGNGNVVEMTPNTVTRYFSNKRKWNAVKEIYDFLDQRIPHSEIIFRVSEKDLALTFKPRGCKFKPRNCDQLIEALKLVTEALVALHDLSFMHRDLEWDKVMMRRNERDDKIEWFLTGFEEAVGAPQIYPHAAATGRHAPEMGRGMHGVKVDVWGVGQLVKSCGVVGIPKLLRELQNRCLDPNPEQRPTAADCYHHLLQLHSSRPPAATEYNV